MLYFFAQLTQASEFAGEYTVVVLKGRAHTVFSGDTLPWRQCGIPLSSFIGVPWNIFVLIGVEIIYILTSKSDILYIFTHSIKIRISDSSF